MSKSIKIPNYISNVDNIAIAIANQTGTDPQRIEWYMKQIYTQSNRANYVHLVNNDYADINARNIIVNYADDTLEESINLRSIIASEMAEMMPIIYVYILGYEGILGINALSPGETLTFAYSMDDDEMESMLTQIDNGII